MQKAPRRTAILAALLLGIVMFPFVYDAISRQMNRDSISFSDAMADLYRRGSGAYTREFLDVKCISKISDAGHVRIRSDLSDRTLAILQDLEYAKEKSGLFRSNAGPSHLFVTVSGTNDGEIENDAFYIQFIHRQVRIWASPHATTEYRARVEDSESWRYLRSLPSMAR